MFRLRHALGSPHTALVEAKRAMHAAHTVPEHRVVDPEGGTVHHFREPADGLYGCDRVVPLDATLHGATVAELAIDESGIL